MFAMAPETATVTFGMPIKLHSVPSARSEAVSLRFHHKHGGGGGTDTTTARCHEEGPERGTPGMEPKFHLETSSNETEIGLQFLRVCEKLGLKNVYNLKP